MFLYHKCLTNDASVDFVSPCLANVIVCIVEVVIGENTYFVERSNKILEKVVDAVCRSLKANYETVFIERFEFRDQQLESITVICGLKELN